MEIQELGPNSPFWALSTVIRAQYVQVPLTDLVANWAPHFLGFSTNWAPANGAPADWAPANRARANWAPAIGPQMEVW